MRYLFGFICVLALGVTGCGQDLGPVAGAGGTAGDGGSGGSGGAGGTAGSGGMAGTGGTAGSGGMAGTGGTAGSGGMAGTGGAGGNGGALGDGACTTDENLAVYEDLVYIDCDGVTHTGDDASSAIGSDCIFGCAISEPPLDGCSDFAIAVLGCFPICPPETIQAAADCVADCTQTATAEVAPPGLSDECVACTGDTAACGAAFCTDKCVSDTNAPECIECRCDYNCIQAFDVCSGLPSDGSC